MALVFIALGSNLNQPLQQIKRAIDALSDNENIKVLAISSLYQTSPVGYTAQADFINAVLKAETNLSAAELLQTLLQLEQHFGRERSFANAPRVLDLDLLAYDQLTIQTPQLNLPHPRMHERNFVLIPLAEIAPDFILVTGQTVVKCLADLGLLSADLTAQQGITKLIN